LIGSISACVPVLFWSVIVLCAVQLMLAILMTNLLTNFMKDENTDIEKRWLVFQKFGTFTRSFFTMFELTLGNFVPVSRMLVEESSEYWAIFMLMYKCTMGFAVVKVITGVFLQQTFAVAASDDDMMVIQKQRASANLSAKMKKLMKKGDKSNDGLLSKTEWAEVLQQPAMSRWLSAMEIEVSDTDTLFDMIDDGDGEISIEELINGVSRLRGAARSIDMCNLMRHMQYVQELVTHLQERVAPDSESEDEPEEAVDAETSLLIGVGDSTSPKNGDRSKPAGAPAREGEPDVTGDDLA